MNQKLPLAVLALSLLLATAALSAENKRSGEEVFAIQDRLFDRDHEVGLVTGYIPDEDFHHAFPLGFDYIFRFNENLSWEVGRVQYIVNTDKDLKDDLEDDFGATPSEFDRIKYAVHSNLLLTPAYGKDAFWNRGILNHQTFAAIGAGVMVYERETSTGSKSTTVSPSLSFGVGRKYFLSPKICLNVEVRDFVSFKDGGVENHVYLGVGVGYRFNLAARKPPEDEAARRLKGYLKEGKSE